MIYMQAPMPNRRGVREVHYVPNRRVAALEAQGWARVALPYMPADAEASEGDGFVPGSAHKEGLAVDLSGRGASWKAPARQILGEDMPASKSEAVAMLGELGYEVVT